MPRLLNRSILRQSLLAMAFDLGGIFSGRLVLVFSPLFESEPWILALFPLVLSVRGSIGGILSGKLGTMLHIGDVEPKLSNNAPEFYSLIRAIFLLTYADTLAIGLVAFVVNLLLGNAGPQHLLIFATVPVLTCLVAMSIAVPVVSQMGMMAFRRGLDPDVLLYPIMSTVDDIVVTVSYVMVVGLTFLPGLLAAMIAAVAVAGGILLIVYVRHRHERVFMKTLTEGGPVVMLSSLLASIGGVGLSSLRDEIERHPSVLMLYPALIDALGDIGSILGSMETTRLALGFVSSYGAALREAFADLVSIEAAAALMHVFFGVAAFLLGRATGLSSNAGQLVATSLVTNLISFLLVSLLSLAVATQTFKRGLDPDNFVIPLVTSVADTGATLALMAALIIVG